MPEFSHTYLSSFNFDRPGKQQTLRGAPNVEELSCRAIVRHFAVGLHSVWQAAACAAKSPLPANGQHGGVRAAKCERVNNETVLTGWGSDAALQDQCVYDLVVPFRCYLLRSLVTVLLNVDLVVRTESSGTERPLKRAGRCECTKSKRVRKEPPYTPDV